MTEEKEIARKLTVRYFAYLKDPQLSVAIYIAIIYIAIFT